MDKAIEAMRDAIVGNMVYVVPKREAKVFAQAALTALDAAGYAVVPKVPTDGMLRAVGCDPEYPDIAYAAMIETAAKE